MANHPNRSQQHQIEYTLRAGGGIADMAGYAAALREAIIAEFPGVRVTVNVEPNVYGVDRIWSRGETEWQYDAAVREIARAVGERCEF